MIKMGESLHEPWSDGALGSASWNPTVAIRFARDRSQQFQTDPVVYRILGVRKGALNITNLTSPGADLMSEAEVLLSGKLNFTIDDVRFNVPGPPGLEEFTEVTLRAVYE